jgi:hypothetical protein
MWYLIKRTVKDPHSPSILKVQRVVEGEIKEYKVQEDVEQAIQRECEVRFLLAHSAPIMNLLLGEKPRYLSDEALAKAIITGTYNISTDLDPATAMILKEIGKLGIKIVNGDSNEIITTPEDFKWFWKKVNEITSSSMELCLWTIPTSTRGAMATDTTGTNPMEHSPQRNGRSPQTRKMLLVHARLYVRRRGMVLCRNDATTIIYYISRWHQEPDKPRGGDSVQENTRNSRCSARRK